MQHINEKITLPVFKKLIKILGEDFSLKNTIQNIEISINTDRNDPFLAKDIVEISNKITQVANTIGCSVSDLKMHLNQEKSDHECAVHELFLNNELYEKGNYFLLKGELVVIEKQNLGVFTVVNVKTKEISHTANYNLNKVSWYTVFMLRDNVSPEELY